MSLEIKINGQIYTNFQNASVILSIAAITRGFSFVSTANENNTFPVKVGDLVKITADGIDVLEGYIELLEIRYDSGSHEIRVGGRSKMVDLVDSSMPTQFEVNGTTLEAIASGVLKSIGLPNKVENEAGEIKDFNDISSSEIGQNAFKFLESFSRKRQVLLTSDGSDTLILTRAGISKSPTKLKNIKGANDNNILSAELSLDYRERFYWYIAKSQLNTSTPDFDSDPEEVSDQEGEVFDDDIRESRRLEFNAEESMESFNAKDRATWEKNLRIGNGLQYRAKIVGNSVNGQLWLPNTIVQIEDEYCQLKEELLIKEVKYDFSTGSGSTTELSMIRKNAFTLEIEQSEREALAESANNVWAI